MNRFMGNLTPLRLRDGKPGYAQDHNAIVGRFLLATQRVDSFMKNMQYQSAIADEWANNAVGVSVHGLGFSAKAYRDGCDNHWEQGGTAGDYISPSGTKHSGKVTIKTAMDLADFCINGDYDSKLPKVNGQGIYDDLYSLHHYTLDADADCDSCEAFVEEGKTSFENIQKKAYGANRMAEIVTNYPQPVAQEVYRFGAKEGDCLSYTSDAPAWFHNVNGQVVSVPAGIKPLTGLGLPLVESELRNFTPNAVKLSDSAFTIEEGTLDSEGLAAPDNLSSYRVVNTGQVKVTVNVASDFNGGYLSFWSAQRVVVNGQTVGDEKYHGYQFHRLNFTKPADSKITFTANSTLELWGVSVSESCKPDTFIGGEKPFELLNQQVYYEETLAAGEERTWVLDFANIQEGCLARFSISSLESWRVLLLDGKLILYNNGGEVTAPVGDFVRIGVSLDKEGNIIVSSKNGNLYKKINREFKEYTSTVDLLEGSWIWPRTGGTLVSFKVYNKAWGEGGYLL